jgi:lipoprotein NlpD
MVEMGAGRRVLPVIFFPSIRGLLLIFGLFFGLLLAGCESTPRPAPVVDRAGAGSTTGNARQTQGQSSNTYVVRKGDTLYSIAQSNGISQKDLAEWNNIQDPAAIQVGQQLLLLPPLPPSPPSPPGQMAQPSLYALPEPRLSSPGPVELRGAAVPAEARPVASSDKLKTEPKALKLPYSEQAVAQLKADIIPAQTAVARSEAPAERELPLVAGAVPSAAAAVVPLPAVPPAPPVAVVPLPAVPPVPDAAETVLARDQVEWTWPTKGKLLEGFSEGTKGIDISGTSGQAINASAAGKVVYSGGGLRGYGKLIIIKHNNIYLSAYAHNDKLLVKEGQTVRKGQKIAEMGSTDSGLVKLHFEIRKNGKPVDPLKYLPPTSG